MSAPANESLVTATTGAKLGRNNSDVRVQNLSSILELLHLSGPLSRSDICADTGLTRSSVAALVGELEAAGLARQGPAIPDGRPGRPSPMVEPADNKAVVAFEIVVDSMAVAVVGLGGRVITQRRHEQPRGSATVDRTVAELARMAQASLADAGEPDVVGVGIAVAGVVDRESGVVVYAPNLDWEGVDLGALIAERCGFSCPVLVRNEGDLALRAEARRGIGIGCHDLIFVSAEVGVGGGIMCQGEFITGQSGLGGEIGHLPVNPTGLQCRCGAQGCFETEVGERALLTRAGLDPDGGRAAVLTLFERAAVDDTDVLASFAEAGRWLGFAIAGLANILAPQKVVLGGLYGEGFDYVATTIAEVLLARDFPTTANLEVVPSLLGHSASLIGAAELAFGPLLADPLGTASHSGS